MKATLRIVNVFILFLVSAGAMGFTWLHRNDGAAIREFDELLARGKEESKICATYAGQWKAAEHEIAVGEKSHTSRAAALKALSLLERDPGFSPSYAAAADLYADSGARFSHNLHQIALYHRRGQVRVYCDLLNTFRQLPLLLSDGVAYRFTAEEHARTRAVVAQFLTAEPRFRSFMEGLVKCNILRQYLETGPAAVGSARSLVARAKALEDRGEKSAKGLMARSRTWLGDWIPIEEREVESRLTQELYAAYYPLAKAAFVSGDLYSPAKFAGRSPMRFQSASTLRKSGKS
jgi:hypothetical protein